MATINPYLNYPGTAEEAFNFYKSIFGGELIIMRFRDTGEGANLPDNLKDKMMHIALPIGGNVLMATDALDEMNHKVTYGTNFQISVSTENEQETERIFLALSAGGKINIPLEKMFWGAYFGMLTDKFEIQWMVSYDEKYAKQA
jgi:PhnB protein